VSERVLELIDDLVARAEPDATLRSQLLELRDRVVAGERPVTVTSFDGEDPSLRELEEELRRLNTRRPRLGVGNTEAARFLHQVSIRR
jgi:hypothetical protein